MPTTDARLFFDDHQWRTVEAATARIIPTDHDPGAREANVVRFIDRYLSGIDYVYANPWGSGFMRLEGLQADAWSKRILQLQARYCEGIRHLDHVSLRRFGAEFAELPDHQQDRVLEEISGASVTAAAPGGAGTAADAAQLHSGHEVSMSQPVTDEALGFFEMMVLHTRCGFYSDPVYGGNRDHVGWRVIGFPGPSTLAETTDGRYSTLAHMTGGEYALTEDGGFEIVGGASAVEAADASAPSINGAETGSTVLHIRTLGQEGSRRVVEAAMAAATAAGRSVCVAVVDRAGHLLRFVRMDGAPLLAVQIAQDKAYTVTVFGGVPTADWSGMVGDEPAILSTVIKQYRFNMIAGGVPLFDGEELVGAVGVSGGTPDQDLEVAEGAARGFHATSKEKG